MMWISFKYYIFQACIIFSVTDAIRNFSIDFKNNRFVKDGLGYRYMSGSMHYARVPQEYWEERMIKIKLAGFNALQFYVEWSSHEPEPGVYKFEGNLDIQQYLKIAQKVGLDVIFRPGPFIDAERDFGGLPYWLLRENKNMKLRTNAEDFLFYVERWFKILFGRMKPYLYQNGGPIIMVQVENEYGSYGLQTGHCNKEYLSILRDISIKYLESNVVLFSTDGAGDDYVMCGNIAGVFSTVDFGPGGNVTSAFHSQRMFQPQGPLVNSEYYPGWLDHWQTPHSKVGSDIVVKTLDEMLAIGANVNMYMIHGGTSFGFTAGSNTPPFGSTPTSYDYDAPISEAGDLTEKFWAIRKTVGKYLPLPEIPPNLQNTSTKGDYGSVKMKYVSTVFDSREILLRTKAISPFPLSFEDISQSAGFVLYETTITNLHTDPAILSVPGIRDRGYIFINSRPRGILSRSEKATSVPIQVDQGDILQILVENQGRVCYGPNIADRKGIIGKVSLGSTVLSNWTILGMPLNDTRLLEKYVKTTVKNKNKTFGQKLAKSLEASRGRMTFWVGDFTIPQTLSDSGFPLDTFLSLDGWHKGVAFINGVNLGRYWPVVGPQKTLYVPGVWLKPHPNKNTIILLEQDKSPCFHHNNNNNINNKDGRCIIKFVTEPDLDGPTPTKENLGIKNKIIH